MTQLLRVESKSFSNQDLLVSIVSQELRRLIQENGMRERSQQLGVLIYRDMSKIQIREYRETKRDVDVGNITLPKLRKISGLTPEVEQARSQLSTDEAAKELKAALTVLDSFHRESVEVIFCIKDARVTAAQWRFDRRIASPKTSSNESDRY